MAENDEWLPTQDDINNYELLSEMLAAQRREFNLLSSKKPDMQLNLMKIRMINRALEPLKEILKHEESHRFLDTFSEEDMPTNSDVVLTISQYETAIEEFKNRYRYKDEYRGYIRWMTKEYPPEHFKDEKNEEGYDDEECEDGEEVI